MNKAMLEKMVAALVAGDAPKVTTADFPCFAEEETAGNPHVSPKDLDSVMSRLTEADIPTIRRAIRAIEEGELGWLGFKVVYDAAQAVENEDNEVTKKYGDQGSADGEPMMFFCNDAKEIVSSREPSPRDVFQMKDVTRGPSMHTEQFDGLTWVSVPLFEKQKVWLLGASDVASELAALAEHTGFEVAVVDYDPSYLNEERFPKAERILLHGGNFAELSNMVCSDRDYVCVLTRGHMFDPQGCIWGIQNNARYVGLMGSKGKNEAVEAIVLDAGLTPDDWSRIKRPIGMKMGAKTPAELAVSIVAELIDLRYQERYSPEAREVHAQHLGLD